MNLRKSIFYICMVFSLVLFVEGLFTIINFSKNNKDFARPKEANYENREINREIVRNIYEDKIIQVHKFTCYGFG